MSMEEPEPMSHALIRTTPAITDPSELGTILNFSLRSLYGDCQPYSHGLSVLQCRRCSGEDSSSTSTSTYEAIIECPSSSLNQVRAALTFPSTPSYFDGALYRFDFIESRPKP
mmetsp:Transcript_8145/g.11990  ORF Transcript_8145/g.11990 Transcript_8145/m.11990 type:complete len:113 (-) Transcript_8145:346-684(-)